MNGTVFYNLEDAIKKLYNGSERHYSRYVELLYNFQKQCPTSEEKVFFSAPARIEICGNHTDHQNGSVLATAINVDAIALAARNDSGKIHVYSQGRRSFAVELSITEPQKYERGKSSALVRGVAAQFIKAGVQISGFDVCVSSDIVTGSGISSSAAFEVLIGSVINHLFCNNSFLPAFIAKAGQKAEVRYFGKPCGLMDQTASAYGGCIMIDFAKDEPDVSNVAIDALTDKMAIFVVHTGGSHAKLTKEYSSIVSEMRRAAAIFGAKQLVDVDERTFMLNLDKVREQAGDRSALRGMHFFAENARVKNQTRALSNGQIDEFLQLVNESGDSSSMLLQNVYADHIQNKSVALALALTKKYFKDKCCPGACRIHGGGFMGTILAFVPHELANDYKGYMENYFGTGAADSVKTRKEGGIAVCKVKDR